MQVAGLRFSQEALPAGLDVLRSEVRDFLAGELAAGGFTPECDSWNAGFSPEFSRKLGERGWLGMTWPKAYGGHERTALERFVVIEELLAAGAPVAAHWIADRQTGPMLLRYGTENQRQRFLPAIAAGDCYFAIGMSEPDSGSDLASVQTRATPVDGGWLVNGRKLWTSHAHRAHHLLMLCRTAARSDDDRHAGLSQLIVDLGAEGVTVRPVISMSGAHHFNEITLDDVFVPDEMVVGRIGDGWRQVTSELAFERSGPERFLSTVPLLLRTLDALDGAAQASDAALIGSAVARLLFVRRLSLGVAAAIQNGEEPRVEAALVKDVGTQVEQAVVDTVQLVVPSLPSAAPPGLLDMLHGAMLAGPGFTLRGGTSEILKSVIAGGLSR